MIDYEKLKRFFEDKCEPSEVSEVKDWLNNHSGTKQCDDYLQNIWEDMGEYPKTSRDLQNEYGRFKMRTNKIRLRRQFSIFSRVAAILFIPILVVSLYLINHHSEIQSTAIELATNIGEQKVYHLPDGTVVTLLESSKIKYDNHFGIDDRRIYFEGEARFQVKKDSLRKFIVSTAKMNLVVTGTIFTMVAQQHNKHTIVELEEGGVDVSFVNTPTKVTRITPNERVILDNESGEMTVREIDDAVESITAPLIIEAASFQSVMSMLETRFHKKIILTGNVGKELFNYRFSGDNIYDLLDIMKYYYNFTYTHNNDTITITFK